MCVFARARGVSACMYVCAYARVFVRLSVCLSASVAVWFAGADQLGRQSCPAFVHFRLSLLSISFSECCLRLSIICYLGVCSVIGRFSSVREFRAILPSFALIKTTAFCRCCCCCCPVMFFEITRNLISLKCCYRLTDEEQL